MSDTTNYALKKPGDNDYYDVKVLDANMDVIDAALADNAKTFPAGGTGTAITITAPSITAYKAYQKITFVASADNNGAATTIKVNSLAALSLYKPNTTAAPTLKAGKAYDIWVGSAADRFFLKASAEGTATTAQVLANVPFSNESDTGILGIMPNKGAVTITPSGSDQIIAEGYHNGNGKVAAVVVPTAKVLNDTTIAGQTGTVPIKSGNAGAPYAQYVDSAPGIQVYPSQGYYPQGQAYILVSDGDFIAKNIPSNINLFGLQGTKPYYAPTSRPQADGIWTGGGSDLYMHLPETGGCWDTDVYFHYNIPNLIPANIKSGVDIAGVVGNVPDGTGKKSFASGTATADSNGAFTVSGLAFRPYMVVIIQNSPQTYANKVNGQQNVRILTDFTFGAWYNGSVTCYGITTGYDQNYNVGAFYTSNKITSNGFYSGKPDYPTGTLAPNASFTWYAYGA